MDISATKPVSNVFYKSVVGWNIRSGIRLGIRGDVYFEKIFVLLARSPCFLRR